MTRWFTDNGYLMRKIPADCVSACCTRGDVTKSVTSWADKLQFYCPPHQAIPYLRNFGAWDDLPQVSQQTLNERCLWVACCEIHERGEWMGIAL